jgi:short chain dehydrogenase
MVAGRRVAGPAASPRGIAPRDVPTSVGRRRVAARRPGYGQGSPGPAATASEVEAEMARAWFITGTSRGFGREWAEAALGRGDRVAATARDVGRLQPLVDRYGTAVLPMRLDVTDRPAAFAAVRQAAAHFGSLDVVVNNAFVRSPAQVVPVVLGAVGLVGQHPDRGGAAVRRVPHGGAVSCPAPNDPNAPRPYPTVGQNRRGWRKPRPPEPDGLVEHCRPFRCWRCRVVRH